MPTVKSLDRNNIESLGKMKETHARVFNFAIFVMIFPAIVLNGTATVTREWFTSGTFKKTSLECQLISFETLPFNFRSPLTTAIGLFKNLNQTKSGSEPLPMIQM